MAYKDEDHNDFATKVISWDVEVCQTLGNAIQLLIEALLRRASKAFIYTLHVKWVTFPDFKDMVISPAQGKQQNNSKDQLKSSTTTFPKQVITNLEICQTFIALSIILILCKNWPISESGSAFIGKYVFVEEIGRHGTADWLSLSPDNDDHSDKSVYDESTDTSDDYDDDDDNDDEHYPI